jgi:S-adenosylmethionine:tRNA ribosyltransferase-isomerase
MMTHPDFYNIETYDYELPEELIAQKPVDPRDSCRLMAVHRDSGQIQHRHFYDVLEYLNPGDVLVRNDTRVMAARLEGIKVNGSAHCEILLLRPCDAEEKIWEALVRPGRKLPKGSCVQLNNGTVVTIGEVLSEDGVRAVTFPKDCQVRELAEQNGTMPLPPYIHERTSRPEDYQTVYSKEAKSAAAPTAGLHFTKELLQKVSDKGVEIADITLEVGIGTFRPVKTADIRQHTMHTERCVIPQSAYEKIVTAKKKGGRVIALGTTVVRTLEGMAATPGGLRPGVLETGIFIYPGFKYQVIDSLITNFHLPKSTLIMLVAAFMGYDLTMRAYAEAVKERYRFFSFGDAMIIL